MEGSGRPGGAVTVAHAEALELLGGLDDGTVDLAYIDPPFATGRRRQASSGGYDDRWPTVDAYRRWLEPHLVELHRVLADHGNLVVHLDWRASHHVKVALDGIFAVEGPGGGEFVNDIAWCYQSGGVGKRSFARKHDNLLWYGKGPGYRFNPQREPYPHDYGDRPGFHPDGRLMNDWWAIPILSTTSGERAGYPTQKPVALLERIIVSGSDPGDVVLDCFCGSGTTGVAAARLGRAAILGDANPEAVRVARGRLAALGGAGAEAGATDRTGTPPGP
jgi:site-specific DNA-methyltransferase (adenine-specific)